MIERMSRMSSNNSKDVNSDSQRTKQKSSDSSTFASPKPTDSGYVKLGESDIYPERKKRLKDYLSGTTKGGSSNLDVANVDVSNKYPIEADGPTHGYTERDLEAISASAVNAFESISDDSSFDGLDKDLKKGSYNRSADLSTGRQVVEVESKINDADNQKNPSSPTPSLGSSGRWGKIGTPGFKRLNVKIEGDQTAGSRHGDYKLVGEDPTSFRNTEEFWNNFFDGRSEWYEKQLEKDGIRRKGISYAGLMLNDERFQIDTDFVEGDPENQEMHESLTGFSYGQYFTHDNPFEKPLFGNNNTIGEMTSTVLLFLEIWLQGLIGANAANLFQVLSRYESINLNGSDKTPWNNIYFNDPQSKDPTLYTKGSSSYHPKPIESFREEKIKEQLLKGVDEINDGVDNSEPAISAETAEALSSGIAKLVDEKAIEALNFPSAILKDLNISVPRATLTSLKGSSPQTEGLNIVKAYNYAAAYGLVNFLASYVVESALESKNLGMYGAMARSIKNSRLFYRRVLSHENSYNHVKRFLGESNKFVRFLNTCVALGDIQIALDFGTRVSVSENKVPLDAMEDNRGLRMAKYRKNKSRKSTFSMSDLPSLNLYSSNSFTLENHSFSLGNSGYFGSTSPRNDKYKSAEVNNRFSPAQVKEVEDKLEVEHMPFSIQDLRTNEVIAFHAFLNSLTDSYAAEWSAQKGFGRLEAAQIYGGASRSIGLSFTMVAFNNEDFDEMWYKINKLTTLVYPQWSRGTVMENDEHGKFIQPFSQVPTASPLARVRVGDIFTSNYSKQNVARLFGLGEEGLLFDNVTTDVTEEKNVLNSAGAEALGKVLWDKGLKALLQEYAEIIDAGSEFEVQFFPRDGDTKSYYEWRGTYFGVGSENLHTAVTVHSTVDTIENFFNAKNNPIIRSFESTAGRGIACAITSIGFDWKMGEVGWNTAPGSKAPRFCEVSLGLTPIHDITPGLDHNGLNRAPIYGVGSQMSNMKGDPHMSTDEYNALRHKISKDMNNALQGIKSNGGSE